MNPLIANPYAKRKVRLQQRRIFWLSGPCLQFVGWEGALNDGNSVLK